jgi:uncharacterized protein YndB with AHSA1/START domain
MKNEPFVIERILNAPVEKVWKAITDKTQMKAWYFDIAEFKPEVGFEFQFKGGADDKVYVHLCKVTDAIPNKKLGYSWRYQGFEGISYVTFELFPEGNKTKLRLTHEGLQSFAANNNSDFDKNNFVAGWTEIIGKNLIEYLERS